ncbi:MAG: hypothetical protein ACLRZH_18350 [Ruthenibacterium lactatiformans]
MKNWKENRALACVVLAAAILGGTFGIGGAKLSSAARSVNEAYAQNIAGTWRCAPPRRISSPRVKRRWARMPRP